MTNSHSHSRTERIMIPRQIGACAGRLREERHAHVAAWRLWLLGVEYKNCTAVDEQIKSGLIVQHACKPSAALFQTRYTQVGSMVRVDRNKVWRSRSER